MDAASPSTGVTSDSATLVPDLAAYRGPNASRSVFELLITVIPFALLWAVMWMALDAGMWIVLVLVVPAAGLLVRLFAIQHDCGHGSLFRQRSINDWIGRVLGVVTLTPYEYWRRSHAFHHANAGNLDRRGIGDVVTLTVREYLALPRWRQVAYRIYRHPLMLFGIAPVWLFIFQHRLPVKFMGRGREPWVSVMATNVALAILVAAMIWLAGAVPFLLIQLPITVLATSIGIWLFYVQHQFEDTVWEQSANWSFQTASLHGSSYYDLPAVLRWFTANIGVHHVHHLSNRIPFYRLPQVLRDHPQLAAVGRITLLQSFACVRMALWDEDSRRLVSFRDVTA